ncbi:SAM-dependent methyltransferase, partial [Campylobacter jejuni]|nr:SAM-dependent methyltransferase [Campylobacter jejuni]
GFFQKNTLINIMGDLGCKLIDEHFLYDEQWIGLFFEKTSENKPTHLSFKIFEEEDYFTESIKQLNNYLSDYKNIALMGGGDTFEHNNRIYYARKFEKYKNMF